MPQAVHNCACRVRKALFCPLVVILNEKALLSELAVSALMALKGRLDQVVQDAASHVGES